MTCSEFLEHYSAYRDQILRDPVGFERMRRHLAECPRCRLYDARIARGVTALRSFSELQPSAQFRRRLARRLAQSTTEPLPITPAPAGLMVAFMLAAAVLLLVWPSARPPATGPERRVARSPLPAIVVSPGPPFVSFTSLDVPAFSATWRIPGAHTESFVGYAVAGR